MVLPAPYLVSASESAVRLLPSACGPCAHVCVDVLKQNCFLLLFTQLLVLFLITSPAWAQAGLKLVTLFLYLNALQGRTWGWVGGNYPVRTLMCCEEIRAQTFQLLQLLQGFGMEMKPEKAPDWSRGGLELWGFP